jgi:hypothetical protein
VVGRLELGKGARHPPIDIAGVLSNDPRLARHLFELGGDRFGGELGVQPVVPFDHQRRESLLCRAHMIGHDGDSIAEPHDLADVLESLGYDIVHALHSAAEHKRLHQCRDLHAGAERRCRPALAVSISG